MARQLNGPKDMPWLRRSIVDENRHWPDLARSHRP